MFIPITNIFVFLQKVYKAVENILYITINSYNKIWNEGRIGTYWEDDFLKKTWGIWQQTLQNLEKKKVLEEGPWTARLIGERDHLVPSKKISVQYSYHVNILKGPDSNCQKFFRNVHINKAQYSLFLHPQNMKPCDS